MSRGTGACAASGDAPLTAVATEYPSGARAACGRIAGACDLRLATIVFVIVVSPGNTEYSPLVTGGDTVLLVPPSSTDAKSDRLVPLKCVPFTLTRPSLLMSRGTCACAVGANAPFRAMATRNLSGRRGA